MLRATLHHAATPCFAAMALLAAHGPAMVPGWSLHGMALMYALMAIFHAGPWLTRGARRFPVTTKG